jgi:hypothetical protein
MLQYVDVKVRAIITCTPRIATQRISRFFWRRVCGDEAASNAHYNNGQFAAGYVNETPKR